ncbi:hypothetical protein [Hymenobacter terrenus]|uniref:hypothetical protein n=1 Tax=Hymenobacter terrenus TaxID=1629124 RepID=UPI00061983F1|nr:hypothetical protein [Hymenobacter terrenus]
MDKATGLAYFRQQYFGPVDHYLGWHDGYEADFICLDQLTIAERGQAETELLAAVQTRPGDPRALLGLGHLRSRAALPALHNCLPFWATYALNAIAQIDAQALDKAQLLHELRNTTSEYQLIDFLVGIRAYFTLAHVGTAITAQIFRLLHHAQYLVRYHALQTLRRLYALPTAALEFSHDTEKVREDAVFQLICKDGYPAKYRQAEQLVRLEIEAAGGTGS